MLSVWLQASRVKSLLISTISVGAGAAVAWWQGHTTTALVLAWLSAVSAQAGTNFTNVAFNYKAETAAPGTLVDPRGSSAPLRSGQLTPRQVRRAALLCFGVSAVSGLALAMLVDARLLLLGIPGIFAGYFYAAPPLRLAYAGLGVVIVFAFMGPVMVAGSYWVAARSLSPGAWAAAIAVGLTAAAVMHVNDLRDFGGDVMHRKRTLATLLGREAANRLMALILTGAFATIAIAVATRALPVAVVVTVLSAPLALRLVRRVFAERDPARLNEAWFRGVHLHTAFGVLLIAALVASALFSR